MFWSAQRLVSRPTRTTRGSRVTASRRPQLCIDSLEDRFAPATLVLLGQPAEVVVSSVSIVNFTEPAPTVLTSLNAPVSSASSIGAHATFDEIPFGFFHPFCQTGVIAEEMASTEPPLAPPAAIQPPMNELPDAPSAPLALPPALPMLPQLELPPAPAPAAPAPVDPKLTILELTGLNDSSSAAIDDRVWEELFKPSTPLADPLALTNDDAASPTLGAALAAISLLSLPPMHNRRERAVALDA